MAVWHWRNIRGRAATPPGATVDDDPLTAYVAAHVWATSNNSACARTSGPDAVSALPGVRRVETTFECRNARSAELHFTAFFELVPTHTDLAQIQTADGRFIEQVFTRDRRSLDVSDAAQNPLQSAGFWQYIALGIMHIFTGIDHQAFLLGLVLLSPRLRDLLLVITGFTIGHSATLALAVTGIFRPHAEFIDSLIGLTIALVGAECLVSNTGRPNGISFVIGALLCTVALGDLLFGGGLPPALLLGGGLFGMGYL